MTVGRLRRRRGGPATRLVLDVVRQARLTGNWLVLVVLCVTLLAVAVAAVGQVVVPWLLYPAL